MMKKTILITTCVVFTGMLNLGNAQDIHLSQYDQAPLLLNPALAGRFNGNHRVIVNYKNQWAGIGEPYQTAAFSYDFTMLKKKRETNYLGGGISFYSDKAGEFEMGITQVNLSLSGMLILNGSQMLSAGLQGGFAQRSIDASNLRWGNQFDGKNFDSNMSSNETFDSYSFGDFSAGVSWSYGVKKTNIASNNEFKVNAGVALLHINKPKQSFFADHVESLYPKVVIHGGSYISLKHTNIALIPSVLLQLQGPSNEINVGTLIRYTLKEESKYTGLLKETAVYFGCFYRVGDAVIPSFMFEIAGVGLGLSYDINISALKTASGGRGGMEISLRFMSPNPFKRGKGTKYTPML